MITVYPSKLGGTVAAPPSKSCSHRALICAALSDKPVRIENLSGCDDVMLTLRCLEALGAHYEGGIMSPIDPGDLPVKPTLYCGESGSTLRFLLPVVAALGCGADFVLGDRLFHRPVTELCDELCRHGLVVSFEKNLIRIDGSISGDLYSVPGNVSSQFISGLLLALPLTGGGKVNIITPCRSADYIDITMNYLKRSGVYVNRIGNEISVSGSYSFEPEHCVEGDWSAAAYWLCASVLGKRAINVTGLDPKSPQGDRRIIGLLRKAGVEIGDSAEFYSIPSSLSPIDMDASDCPDLVPPIAVLCSGAKGQSRIYNASALRAKESDRLNALNIMLTSMGIDVKQTDDELIINGAPLHGALLSSFSDHRIAMAALIAASVADFPSTIDDAQCIAKSYPNFLIDYSSLGGHIL